MLYRIIKQVFLIINDIIKFLLNYKYKFVRNNKNSKNAIVIGNGPSLNSFLYEKSGEINNYEIYVCNAFAETEYFELLKPRHYSLLDPLYFLPNEKNFSRIENTWKFIIEKTTWSLKLYIACNDDEIISTICRKYGFNSNIKFVKISTVLFKSRLKFALYNFGVGLIASMTVVHLSLNIAILNKHSEIFLAGVDQSWHEGIKYDNDTHDVYIDYNNFNIYNKYVYGKGYFTGHDLVDEFFSLYNSLLGFRNLNYLASLNSVKIYRATKSYLHFLPFNNLNYDRRN